MDRSDSLGKLLLKYVDDAKAIGITTNIEDVERFQEHLQTLYDWAKPNSMVWNNIKFNVIIVLYN